MNKPSVISNFLILFIANVIVHAQNILPGKNQIIKQKISEVIVSNYNVTNKNHIKVYQDTLKFDMAGNLAEKRITVYDTNSENKWSGDWNYTYDSLGNRLQETGNTCKQKIMDYFIYVYDSSRIKKKIWNYWINLKLVFSGIYEMQYDSKGRVKTELVENGNGEIDSVFSFQYNATGKPVKATCTADREYKDTINTIRYFYNKNDRLSQKTIREKGGKKTEEYTYSENNNLVKTLIAKETTSYKYDNPKTVKTMYAFTYIYR